MDNENNVNVNEEMTQETTDTLEYIPDPVPEDNSDESAGKLGMAIMGLGGLALAGGVVALIGKLKKPKADDKEEPEEKPKKEKKQKVKKVRGAKLTLHEKLTGYRDEDPPEEIEEEESTEEG